MKKVRVFRFILTIFAFNIVVSSCYGDVIDGPTDSVGTPRNLITNPIAIGTDSTQTTSVVDHVLVNVSDAPPLSSATEVFRLGPAREGTVLILQNSDMVLDGNYTLSVAAMKITGDCQITGTPGSKLILKSSLLQIMAGSSLKVGPNVELIYTPTSEVFETGNSPRAGTATAIKFQDSASKLVLCDTTLTISNDIGARFIGGNLVIEGNCIIDNATTDTQKALFLGASITDTNKSNKNVGDCNLIIKDGAKLTVRNAGIELRNRGISHFLGANGSGLLEIENTPGNFLFDQTVDFNGNGIGLSSTKLAGKTLKGKILNSITTATAFQSGVLLESVSWSPDGKFLAIGRDTSAGITEIVILRFDGSTVENAGFANPDARVEQVSWSPDGRFLSAAVDGGSTRIYRFNGSSLAEIFNASSDTNVFTVDWASDGNHIAVGRDGPSTGAELFLYRPIGSTQIFAGQELFDDVDSVHWSKDAQFLAVAATDTLRIYRANDSTLTEIVVLDPGSDPREVRWSPDGQYLATVNNTSPLANQGFNVYSFDGVQTTTIQSVSLGVLGNSVDWSPDGRYLVIGTSNSVTDSQLKIYELVNGEVLIDVIGVETPERVNSVRWSPDGNFIAAGLNDPEGVFIYRVQYGDLEPEARFDNSTVRLHKDLQLENLKLRLS